MVAFQPRSLSGEKQYRTSRGSLPVPRRNAILLSGDAWSRGRSRYSGVGIDEDGRLVVFELKREKLTRAAVAQVLDYCTYLETLPDSEIGTLPTDRSGKDGIERTADFEECYGSQSGESLRPVSMVLADRARCERPPNGVPTGGQGYRHPAGDLPWLRSRP